MNRLVQEIDARGKTITTVYDAASRVTSITDRNGRKREWTYDAADQVSTEVWKNSGGTVTQTTTFSYDVNGNLTSAVNAQGTLSYSYDAVDRVAAATDVWGKTLTYTYDAIGQVVRRDDPTGGILTSVYDAIGQLTSRRFSASGQEEVRADFGYNARGEQTSVTRYSDVAGVTQVGQTTYSYDAAGNTTGITHRDSLSAIISQMTYVYDLARELTSETVDTVTKTYTYDVAGQITSDGVASYTYDVGGNRSNGSQVIGTGNRLTSDSVGTYTYDDEGNLTSRTVSGVVWNYSYDNDNRLTSVTKTVSGSVTYQVDYQYDAFGNRVQSTTDADGAGSGSSVTERYAYDGDQLWADLNGSTTVHVYYMYGDQVDQLLVRSVASTGWYLTDRLGTVNQVTNMAGVVLDAITYDGFGQVVSESMPTYGDRFKWTGREYNADTGLQYNRARYYLSSTGRWLSEDPIRWAAGDSNLYRYVGNASTSFTDPSGLDPDGDLEGIGGGGGGGGGSSAGLNWNWGRMWAGGLWGGTPGSGANGFWGGWGGGWNCTPGGNGSWGGWGGDSGPISMSGGGGGGGGSAGGNGYWGGWGGGWNCTPGGNGSWGGWGGDSGPISMGGSGGGSAGGNGYWGGWGGGWNCTPGGNGGINIGGGGSGPISMSGGGGGSTGGNGYWGGWGGGWNCTPGGNGSWGGWGGDSGPISMGGSGGGSGYRLGDGGYGGSQGGSGGNGGGSGYRLGDGGYGGSQGGSGGNGGGSGYRLGDGGYGGSQGGSGGNGGGSGYRLGDGGYGGSQGGGNFGGGGNNGPIYMFGAGGGGSPPSNPGDNEPGVIEGRMQGPHQSVVASSAAFVANNPLNKKMNDAWAEKNKEILETLRNLNRFAGFLQATGGAVQLYLSPYLGPILGAASALNAIDNIRAGYLTMRDGESHGTATGWLISQGAQAAGVKEQTADEIGEYGNMGIGIAFTLGAAIGQVRVRVPKAEPPPTSKPPQQPPFVANPGGTTGPKIPFTGQDAVPTPPVAPVPPKPVVPSEVPPIIYREGRSSPSNLTPRPQDNGNLSFRDSLSNPVNLGVPGPLNGRPVFRPGEPFTAYDTSKLPPGTVRPDGVPGSTTTPPGHVSVNGASPEALKNAAIPRPPGDSGKFPK
ncbi:MAG: RHS repeat-associated core domain-containing protein [Gemmatales bacterium]